ncbi:MAG: SDR family oxidoreductase [Deltaproteobacteria bacterium]|nr:SDR family oxidoreductase [Deltaproteobacteria bacterium]
MTSFQEKYGPWALVTGASSGIGAEFAKQLAERSLNLILVARRTERLDDLASHLEKQNNVQVKTITADLSRPDFMSLVYPLIQTREIGLLVNNAGFGIGGYFLENDLQRELALLDVNCRAPLILAHEIGRKMAERRRGGIIFVSSVSAYLATPFEASYAASKAYDLFLAESLWYELRQQGVDVLCLCPGSTMTEFHEISGTREFAAMAVEPVVALALKTLGKKPSVITGWHNRLLVCLVKMTPRRIVTILAGRVMKSLRRP